MMKIRPPGRETRRSRPRAALRAPAVSGPGDWGPPDAPVLAGRSAGQGQVADQAQRGAAATGGGELVVTAGGSLGKVARGPEP